MRSFDPRYSPRYRPSRSRSSSLLGLLGGLLRGRGLIAVLLLFLGALLVIAGTRGDDEPTDTSAIAAAVEAAMTRLGYVGVEVAVSGQRVSLSGSVPLESDVYAAGQVALSIKDAVQLDNLLVAEGQPALDEPTDPGAPTAAEIELQHALTRAVAFDPIRFDIGSADIAADSQPTIATVALLLNGNAAARVEIRGYTDSDGDPQANLDLSENRAQAVLTALGALGVDTSRLTAIGLGDADPIAPNETQEGKERNRRIELRVLSGDAPLPDPTGGDVVTQSPDPVAPPADGSAPEGSEPVDG